MFSGQWFVVAIVAVVCAAGIIKHYLRMKVSRPREDPAYRARLDTLERRVQTLEKIVTEEGYDLKREFEKL